jgi:hypothetical protein
LNVWRVRSRWVAGRAGGIGGEGYAEGGCHRIQVVGDLAVPIDDLVEVVPGVEKGLLEASPPPLGYRRPVAAHEVGQEQDLLVEELLVEDSGFQEKPVGDPAHELLVQALAGVGPLERVSEVLVPGVMEVEESVDELVD